MKTIDHHQTVRARSLACAIALAFSICGENALAQITVDFSPVPLTTAIAVSPNLMYIHDDSNSMYWSYLPDNIHWRNLSGSLPIDFPYELYMSPQLNMAYYNPNFRYLPPPAPKHIVVRDADGNIVGDGTLGNAKFTAAWFNGYDLENNGRNASGYYSSDKTATATMTPENTVYRKVDLSKDFMPTSEWSKLMGSSFNSYLIAGSRGAISEFLPVIRKGAARYYNCPLSAWNKWPNLSTGSSNFNLGLCTQHIIQTEEQKQNFANWYSYYRTRNYIAKAGIGRAFDQLDSSIRVGWGLINKINTNVDGKTVTAVMEGVRPFNQSRKDTFLDWLYKIQTESMNNTPPFKSQLYGLSKTSGTPLRAALDGVGQYYDRTNTTNLGPWAENPASPGSAANEKNAECRKSFAILMTDGYWNGNAAATSGASGNADGSAGYPFADTYSGTLADVAYYYWSRDLVPSVANKVPKTPVPGKIDQYRDPAEYQHMTTFTIGLGMTGTIKREDALNAMNNLGARNISWPQPASDSLNNIDDLLHAGINGHGDSFSATNPAEFVTGMQSIINSVNSVQRLSSGKLETNTTEISSNTRIYRSGYKPSDWSGELTAHDPNTESSSSELGVEIWRASEQMPTPVSRRIYTRSNNVGATFQWSSLDFAQQGALGGMTGGMINTAHGQKILDFIRGSGSNEGHLIGQFRERTRSVARAPLGDSPHNTPVYVKYTDAEMIFLGANDGMLHAFDAADGTERFAYIPAAVIPNLPMLTFSNGYSVDGEILVTTPSQTPGKYMLVGALGRGGKALYGLDVTRPKAFAAADVRWEVNGNNCFDPNPMSMYLGNVLGEFAYVEIGGVPSAAFGNGYNSCNGKAALGIVNVDTGGLNFIKASDDFGNGLAAPVIWNFPGSDKTLAYAGDLHGKLWKFDMKTLGAPIKLFDAGAGKPITSRVTAAVLGDDNKSFLFFGTGRYLSLSDKRTTTQQSFYGLIDENHDTVIPAADLQLRTFGPPSMVGGLPARSVVPLPGNSNKKGWMLNLIEPGERIVNPPLIVKTQHGEVAVFTSIIPPVGDSCSPKGSGWLYFVDAKTGGPLDFVFLDINGDGKFDENDMTSAIKLGDKIGMLGATKIVGARIDNEGHIAGGTRLVVSAQDSPDSAVVDMTPETKPQSGRILWREITD
jgi:type IV pilus assembly protein PilY1